MFIPDETPPIPKKGVISVNNRSYKPVTRKDTNKMRLKELFNPRLKCERLGHVEVKRKIRIRKEAEYGRFPRAVVVDCYAFQTYCKRCEALLNTEIGEEIDSFTSCSMPSDMWDEMRENGFCVVS